MTDSLDELIVQLNAKRASGRRRAAEAIGRLADRRAVPALLDHITDDDVDVQIAVVRALGRIDDDGAIQPLIDWVVQEPCADSAEPAAQVLVRFRARAVDKLLASFANKTAFSRMCYPAWILGKIGEVRAVNVLLAALDHPDDG